MQHLIQMVKLLSQFYKIFHQVPQKVLQGLWKFNHDLIAEPMFDFGFFACLGSMFLTVSMVLVSLSLFLQLDTFL